MITDVCRSNLIILLNTMILSYFLYDIYSINNTSTERKQILQQFVESI